MDWEVKTSKQLVMDLENIMGVIRNAQVQEDPPLFVNKQLYRELSKDCPNIRVGCYAPGNYMCICGKCGRAFVGDKRAIRCYACAVEEQKEKV